MLSYLESRRGSIVWVRVETRLCIFETLLPRPESVRDSLVPTRVETRLSRLRFSHALYGFSVPCFHAHGDWFVRALSFRGREYQSRRPVFSVLRLTVGLVALLSRECADWPAFLGFLVLFLFSTESPNLSGGGGIPYTYLRNALIGQISEFFRHIISRPICFIQAVFWHNWHHSNTVFTLDRASRTWLLNYAPFKRHFLSDPD